MADPTSTEIVLVAVDLSAPAAAALSWAAGHARMAGQRLEVVHVVHVPPHAPDFYGHSSDDRVLTVRERAELAFSAFLDDCCAADAALAAQAPLTRHLVTGLPVRRILDLVSERGAAHVVVGCSGRGSVNRFLLGSTACAIATQARVPVTMVKAPTADPA